MDLNELTQENIMTMGKEELIKLTADIIKHDCFELIEAAYKNDIVGENRIVLRLFECSVASVIASLPPDKREKCLDELLIALKNDISKMFADIQIADIGRRM